MNAWEAILAESGMNPSEEPGPLQGQTALVIHATTGMGPAIAEALAGAGAKVMINYLDQRERAEQLAMRIRNKQGQAMIFRADAGQENQLISMLDVLIAYWGRLDILINHAGLAQQIITPSQHYETITINMVRQFIRTREIAGDSSIGLRDAPGKIICVPSEPDVNLNGNMNSLMKTLAQELCQQNVHINAILPAPEMASALSNPHSRGQACNPEAIAKLTVWLASDEADSCNGEIFYVDAGKMPETDRTGNTSGLTFNFEERLDETL